MKQVIKQDVLLHEVLHAADAPLQWAWFGFKMTTEADAMLDDNVFGCFASVESILFKNNEILQSVCELQSYWHAVESKN